MSYPVCCLDGSTATWTQALLPVAWSNAHDVTDGAMIVVALRQMNGTHGTTSSIMTFVRLPQHVRRSVESAIAMHSSMPESTLGTPSAG